VHDAGGGSGAAVGFEPAGTGTVGFAAVSDAPHLSIVLPAYNEQARLPETLSAWVEYLSGQSYSWEIVVADDGSRDRTADVAREFAAVHPRVRVVSLPQNRGKGGAVREGMLAAAGEVILFADADLGIPAHFTDAALRALDAGAQVATGERRLRTYASEERSITRLLAGLAVQVSRRALGLTFIRDSQCGFKAFRRDIARAVFGRAKVNSFAFDIEVLYLARRLGARVQPFPVEMSFRAGSTYDVRKHLPRFLKDVFRVRLNALRGVYD
jgi:dolichyl-phosphate beta-glucosyltransferase